jgi:para-nitrobenzyl esterase
MAKWRLGLQPIATAFVGVFLATAVAVAAETGGPIVRTTEGPVQGIVRNSIVEFLGIPYAAAPVGDLRWQPPKRHDAWTDPLRATEFSNTCPQITELGVFAGPVSVTEDCLYLNVFAAHFRACCLKWRT